MSLFLYPKYFKVIRTDDKETKNNKNERERETLIS